MELLTNRYGQVVPSVTTSTGVVISTPNYINNLTAEQRKALMNAFRNLKQKQLLDQGVEPDQSIGSLSVKTAVEPGLTECESAIQMSEAVLREHIWSRSGLSERLLAQVQQLTGVTVVTREDLEEAHRLWMDYIFGNKEQKNDKPRTTRTRKTSKATKKETTTSGS